MKSQRRMLSLSLLVASVFPRFDGNDEPLDLVVDSVDALSEGVRSLYAKRDDGKFALKVRGVEDVTGLKNSLEAARGDAKKAREEARRLTEQFKGIDVEKYHQLVAAIERGDEEALIKSGKFDEVFNKRLTKVQEQHKRDLGAAAEREKQALTKADKWAGRVLENAVRVAAAKAGLHPTAIDDAVLHAKSVFTLDEDGNAVKLGEDGRPVLGKSGKDAYNPIEWLEERKEDKPHWFPTGSSGGGASGGSRNTGGARQMKRSQFDALPANEKSKAAREYTIVD